MSKKSLYLLGLIALTIIIGTIFYWFFCCKVCCGKITGTNKNEVINTEVAKPKQEPTLIPFSIKDANGDLSYEINDNFNFNTSDFKILTPISSSIEKGTSIIKEYLDTNGNKRFNIVGFYRSDEINDTAYPNLGLARAKAVENYMISKGISPKLINIFGKLNDDLIPDSNNILHGPLAFDIFTRNEESVKNDELLKASCDSLKNKPLKLYFKTGQASINLTPEQRQKFVNISKCVDKLGVKIIVLGHTDNTGNPDANMKLGQDRANFVKNYLIRNGILQENISATSKGQNQPIADNATEEGRALNRRIEVTIN
ncbi:OmpA family protein [Tenacibaculum sp. 190524A02b]|uniref:OmpA-OmpF porin, OOP family n=1 Tax=Tenacibaculum vairaonense TaxID=3137860 RepID=A0ABM9PQR2_9FLAO